MEETNPMKKVLVLMLSLLMLAAFAGCGKDKTVSDTDLIYEMEIGRAHV